jgi:ribosomal protein L23
MIKLIPHTTEKAHTLSAAGIYVFKLDGGQTSKQAVQSAVEQEFQVTVTSVRILVRKGKVKRYSRGKRAFPGKTTLSSTKFAYVTLKSGDKIKLFEEETTTTDSAPQDAKAAAKELGNNTAAPTETKKAGLLTRRRTGNRGDK